MPVRQKTKICLITTVTDSQGNKRIHRRYTTKSKGSGKGPASSANKKLTLKMYCPITRKHEEYTETKMKWKT